MHFPTSRALSHPKLGYQVTNFRDLFAAQNLGALIFLGRLLGMSSITLHAENYILRPSFVREQKFHQLLSEDKSSTLNFKASLFFETDQSLSKGREFIFEDAQCCPIFLGCLGILSVEKPCF